MNQNIIFGLLIVFLILIIILLILLLIFPKETKSLGIGLGICSIITIIIGWLYTKNIDNNSCACGKGECKKCGGINLSDKNLKDNINTLIGLLNVDGPYKYEGDDARLNKVNNLLVNELKWKECGTQEDPTEFLNNILGKKTNILVPVSDNSFAYQYILNKENDNYNIDDTRLPINNLSTQLNDKENFNIIGLIVHSGNKQGEGSGHYIALVRYEDSWYSCDDNICTKLNFNNEDLLFNYLKEKHVLHIIRAYLWKKKEKKLKIGSPFGLINFGNTCYSNSALQLLLATDLLDDEEVKSEEEKANNIIEEARKNMPKLQNLQTKIENFSNSIHTDLNKIPDDYYFLENNIIWHIKGTITQEISKIYTQIEDDIKFINNIINNPDLKKSTYFYTDFIPKLDEMNLKYDKNINEINKNIELVNQQYNNLKILNDLTSDFIEFEKEYNNNKNNFSNAEIEKKIIQIKENIQNTFKEFKVKIQIKEEVKKDKFTIEQIKKDIESVKKEFYNKPNSKPILEKISINTNGRRSSISTSTFPAPTSAPASYPSAPTSASTSTPPVPTPAPTPKPAPVAPTPATTTPSPVTTPTPASTPPSSTSTPPAPTSASTPPSSTSTPPAPTSASVVISAKSSKTISSLPVYEFSTGEIEEAWEKELSTSKPKKVENTNTEFDKYLNKLLKENV